jgi:hypothetical protein
MCEVVQLSTGHPTVAGTFLAGQVLFQTMLKMCPVGRASSVDASLTSDQKFFFLWVTFSNPCYS